MPVTLYTHVPAPRWVWAKAPGRKGNLQGGDFPQDTGLYTEGWNEQPGLTGWG